MSLFKRENFSTFFYMNKALFLAAVSLVSLNAHSQIREFQTTRLMSSAGAGVASILSTEAAVLNPAASAFFEGSSFSYQGYRTSLDKKSEVRDASSDDFPSKNNSQGLFMSDNSGPVKGGAAYISQDENSFERKRAVLHGAANLTPSTSLGVSYNFIEDKYPKSYSNNRHQSHHQASFGMIHIIDEDTILGIVILDPTRTTPGEERVIAGFQYNLGDRFKFIGDVGAQYTKDVSDKYLWRGAIQMNIFSDFYVRVGQFYDNITHLKGMGWGASWMGPRFGLEFAQKYSEQFGSGFYVYEDEKLVDTSLSAIIIF
jgi:hypothetical protein